jgi:subtilisin family serine protease
LLAGLSASYAIEPAVSGEEAPVKLRQVNISEMRARATTPARNAPVRDSHILLVMPNSKADPDDVLESLKEVHGKIVDSIGSGDMKVLVVEAEEGKLDDTEKILRKDAEHFTAIQRNYSSSAQLQTEAASNDPYLPAQWYLGALNTFPAWKYTNGAGATIGVGDTGCQRTNVDLAKHIYPGVNTSAGSRTGNIDIDPDSHGTLVAATGFAQRANGVLTAGPAGHAPIFPVTIANSLGQTDDLQIIRAISHAAANKVRLLNFSYASTNPAYSLANPKVHPALHQYLKWYHDRKNGLVFIAAGNSGQRDPSPRLPYLIMVSALSPDYILSWFSNYGPIWFTAPGETIVTSNRVNRVATVSGTSFSAPLVASIAALVLSRNPSLRNVDIERILVRSCAGRNSTTGWNQYYGFGLPDAGKAVSIAR